MIDLKIFFYCNLRFILLILDCQINLYIYNLSKFKKSPIYTTITSWNKTPTNLPFGKIKSHKNGFQKYLLIENILNDNIKNHHLLTPFKK